MKHVTAGQINQDLQFVRNAIREDEVEDRDLKDMFHQVVNDDAWEDLEDLVSKRNLYDKFQPVVDAYKAMNLEWDKFIIAIGKPMESKRRK